jgi:hypothetical protein
MTPCGPFKVNRDSGGICRNRWQAEPSAFMLLSCSTCSSTPKMEAAYSSETSVHFQRTTWRYIPEDRTLNKSLYFHRTQSVLVFIGAEAFKNLASFMKSQISLPSGNDKLFNVNKYNVNNAILYGLTWWYTTKGRIFFAHNISNVKIFTWFMMWLYSLL